MHSAGGQRRCDINTWILHVIEKGLVHKTKAIRLQLAAIYQSDVILLAKVKFNLDVAYSLICAHILKVFNEHINR